MHKLKEYILHTNAYYDYCIMKYSPSMVLVHWYEDDTDGEIIYESDKYIRDNEFYILCLDMRKALREDDLETYKILFDKYINNSQMCEYFTYWDYELCPHHHLLYPYCTCINEEDDPDDIMEQENKYTSFIKCTCANGKYFLALHDAYYKMYRYIPKDVDRKDLNIKKYCEDERNNCPKTSIVQYLEDLHYESHQFPLKENWNPTHVPSQMSPCVYEGCETCNEINEFIINKKNKNLY